MNSDTEPQPQSDGSNAHVLAEFKGRARVILRVEGLPGISRRVLQRLRRKPRHHCFCVVSLPLDRSIPVRPLALEVEIHPLGLQDDEYLAVIDALNENGNTCEDLLKRLSDGQRCFLAVDHGRIASWSWWQNGKFEIGSLGRRFQLAPHEAYYYDGFTPPEYRGKRIHAYLLAQAASAIGRSDGRTIGLAFIHTANHDSRHSSAAAGATHVGWVGFIEILGIRFHYLRGRHVLPATTRRLYFERT